MEIAIVGFVFALIGCLLAGLVAGYFLARFLFKKAMKDNPPISRDMIKAMYRSMGRTPSEAQVNQTMKAIDNAQKNPRR
ncbi:YneF family protein [Treponema rectale]|uniref:YneF family protein n=1 Tax=Treponema rectale TaxID=744512 RepID=A0A7M1XNT3_9SPIR|nr:YneF family protein [Treponema rectale]